ncbi:hypothetical protein AMECASPLE_039000, partial [Ameca splendens]
KPCPPSTNCSTTTRATVPNSLFQGPTCSGLTCAQLRCLSPPPGGSFLIPIDTPVPVFPAPPRFL